MTDVVEMLCIRTFLKWAYYYLVIYYISLKKGLHLSIALSLFLQFKKIATIIELGVAYISTISTNSPRITNSFGTIKYLT